MIDRLQKQVDSLLESRAEVERDIRENDEFGKRLRALVAERLAECEAAAVASGAVTPSARADLDRYDSYVGELDRVLRLLQRVSGKLARVDNALLALDPDAASKERVC